MHIDEDKKFDKRTIERNLRQGIISPEEWKKYLKGLPDVSDNVDSVMVEEEQKEETTEEQGEGSMESVEEEASPKKE